MSSDNIIFKIKEAVGNYPDFPKKGIVFRDFFPILQNPELLEELLNVFQNYIQTHIPGLQCIAGVESRGFLIGPALALKLKVPFIPIRKPGKLPGKVKKESYSLEYGTVRCDTRWHGLSYGILMAAKPIWRRSMEASVRLIRSIGGVVEHCLSVMELSDLNGRNKISAPVYSVLQF
ncbi:adenine phosphoribosyltransferase [Nephila pilipes]|uniref:adenine phosphoribosyltransferase n=1 Tax=Nephila pilipes TaxID=299642 RepID=A0A8X6TDS4_NEPPI|nr:adenine phosphoribosyltransferase [Nephila pilipes]